MKLGFESEYVTNGSALCARLHEMGLVGSTEPHGYHCRCSDCDVRTGMPLRVQFDSSVDVEVISRIIEDWQEVEDFTTGLQEAAVAIDAEPGTSAGFHVHSSVEDRGSREQHRIVHNFLLWEPTLRLIAGGAWGNIRSANGTARNALSYLVGSGYGERPNADQWYDWLAGGVTDPDLNLRDLHLDSDRHNALNVGTGLGTFEFRLWNSTRSAWRMELFCRLSDALTTPRFVSALCATGLLRCPTGHNGRVQDVIECAADQGFDDLARLLTRQHTYRSDLPTTTTDPRPFTRLTDLPEPAGMNDPF